jgi:hypothetical protein
MVCKCMKFLLNFQIIVLLFKNYFISNSLQMAENSK